MDKKTVIVLVVGVVIGVVFAPQIAKIPGISKLPQL